MKKLVSYLTILFLAGACTSTKYAGKSSAGKLASLYNPSEFSLNADYKVFHISETMTSLYIRLYPSELLFNQANEEGEYRALIKFDYRLFEVDEDEGLMVADSSEFNVKLNKKDQSRASYFTTEVLTVESGKLYLVRMGIEDLNRGSLGLNYFFIDKRTEVSAQNMCAVSPVSTYPKFLNYVYPDEVFRINCRGWETDTIYMDFMEFEKMSPLQDQVEDADFLSNAPKVDTTVVFAYSDSLLFTLPEKGMYRFRLDSTSEEGMTLMNFGDGFPKVQEERQLYEALYYIAMPTEYRDMGRSDNLKLEVDNFWLKRNKNKEKARELIRVYYNRVLYSNLYFTGRKEGWKTDRGMVFILFGPPDRMLDNGLEQKWYYISKKQGEIVEFEFERKVGAYSNSELIWKKSASAVAFYNSAVNSWRSGKIYSLSR